MEQTEIYERIQALLAETHTTYRVLEHAPEGRTEVISQLRGNRLEQAAKAMVLVASRKKSREYFLVVVGGDRRINFDALKTLIGSSHVGFAPPEKAAQLTGCVMGSVPPFSFAPELKLIVDREFLNNQEIVFNAGRLDRSFFLGTEDYVAVARPEIHNITRRPL